MADNFVVSARKYRPVVFDTVVGQSHITTTLRNAIRTSHLAQAFLFCGPRGVGKTTTARILAKTINCQALTPDVEPCGKCESCVSFQNSASFNIHELDAASNNSVDDIRNLIDQVRYPPQTGKYKIYIIDEVHMLSAAAFNAFLKTLEEPPTYAIFILATTEKHKILPTILSRCQIFDFNRIQVRDMADHLASIATKEGVTADREALELIAQKADGGLRDALSMFDLNVTFSTDNHLKYSEVVNNLHVLDYDYYFQLTDTLLGSKTAQSLLIFDEILRKGFDGHLFVVGLLEHLRNLLVCQDAATVQLLEVSDMARNKYLEQSQKATVSFLLSALSIGSQCDLNYKMAKNHRLHVELCLLKLANLSNIFEAASLPSSQPAATQLIAEPLMAYQTKTVATPTIIAPPMATSKLRQTVDLNFSTSAIVQKNTTQDTNQETTKATNDVAFGQQKGLDAWRELMAFNKKRSNSATEEVILNRDVTINDTTFELTLDNTVQESMLHDLKSTWVNFLRTHLQNSQVQIATKIVVQSTRRPLYSPQEKLNTLAEKNPFLLDLQRALALEVDF
jgi:DNA polymerase III subunit gamma/tau